MEEFWFNLKKQPIYINENKWYDLDHDCYCDSLPNEESYHDKERRIFSLNHDNFCLFYIINGIRVMTPRYSTTNISEIPTENIHRLSNFTLKGLFTKCRVLKVKSSTCLDLAFFLPMSFLAEYYCYHGRLCHRGLPHSNDQGVFIRERCKLKYILSYIDTPVIDRKIRELLAIEQLTAICNSLGNVVYADFHSNKEVTLYVDELRSTSINVMLNEYQHPEIGPLVKVE